MSAEILELYKDTPDLFDPLADHPNPEQLLIDSLTQGTLLAGREKPFNWEIDAYTSEAALHRYRAVVEVEALINLSERGPIEVKISENEKATLRSLTNTDVFDPSVVMAIDHFGHNGKPPIEHDVKAVEVYLSELLDENELGHLKPWIHFGMTSEDTNNLAYNLMLRDVTNKVLIPSVSRVADRLAHLSATNAETPTLGMTHAQKASPTTIGKQFGYLLSNITEVLSGLETLRFSGKFSGAVGNHNPETVLFPDFDYDAYAKDFVESLGFEYAPIEHQRNNHISVVRFLQILDQLTSVGKDATDNVWFQILGRKQVQRLISGEKGSSTMAHKINPWRLENTFSLFEQAAALLHGTTAGLIESRHERDLSDHDWQRAYGDIIGRIAAAFNYFAVQLDRLTLDPEVIKSDLDESWEVLSELLQSAGRLDGNPDAYDAIVALTQGRHLDEAEYRKIVENVIDNPDLAQRLLSVRPESYVGTAAHQARAAVVGWHASKLLLSRGVLDESTCIDAILFDLDDTLHFGVKEELMARIQAVLEQFDSTLSPEEIAPLAAHHDYRQTVATIVELHNSRHHRKITLEEYDEGNLRVSGSFDHLFYAPVESRQVLETLRESGKKIGLVTTRGSVSLGRVLELHGFHDQFNIVIGGGDVTRRKPHPEPLAIALDKLGVEASRSLYVGDDQAADIGAAKSLGMKTALINQNALDPLGPIPTYHWTDLTQLTRRYGR